MRRAPWPRREGRSSEDAANAVGRREKIAGAEARQVESDATAWLAGNGEERQWEWERQAPGREKPSLDTALAWGWVVVMLVKALAVARGRLAGSPQYSERQEPRRPRRQGAIPPPLSGGISTLTKLSNGWRFHKMFTKLCEMYIP